MRIKRNKRITKGLGVKRPYKKYSKKVYIGEEYLIQSSIVDFVRTEYPEDTIFSVPNEATRFNSEFFKKSGVLAGAPDLVFIQDGIIFLIECKTDKGKLSLKQRELHNKLKTQKTPIYLIRSLEEFKLLFY